MAGMARDFDRKVRTGLILVGVNAIIALGIFFLDVAVRATAEGERITVLAPAAPGLRPGSPVWVAGRPVGRVISVALRPPGSEGGNVIIETILDRGVDRILRRDAAAEVRASDLLEPVVVSIDPGTVAAGPRIDDRPLRTVERPLDQAALLALTDTLFQAGRRLADQAGVSRTVLASGSGSLQRLRTQPEIMRGIRSDLDRLQDALERDMPTSTLARLASDSVVGPSVRSLRDRVEALASSPGRAGAERAAETMSAAVAALEARVESLTRRLDAGEGTAGRALRDGEWRRQVEILRTTLRALAQDLAFDPSRWLRIRVF